jgi:hypothetical protein
VPIEKRKASELSLRADFFRSVIELTLASARGRGVELFYHECHPLLLAHVYFALHDSFKANYVDPKHLSDAAKRAAATCAAVIAVAPLHLDPDKNSDDIDPVNDLDIDYPNPFLATRCASAILPHPFHKKTWDARRRDYCGYTGLAFPSIEPIIEEARQNGGLISTTWPLPTLSPQEESTLCLLANGFQTAALFQTPEQEER